MDRMKRNLDNAKCIYKVCRYQLILQLHDTKTWIIFLIILLYLNSIMSPLREFAETIGQGITPWLLPVLTNDMVCSMIIFSLWCFMVCDTPFQNQGYLYYAGRAGKINWLSGELTFLFLFSGIYLLAINIFLIVLSLPYAVFSAEWGKTLGTLAYTSASAEFYMLFSFPVTLMSSMEPLEATILSFLLTWLALFWLALCIFFINRISRSSFGAAAGLIFVFLDLTIYNVMDWKWWRFSPISVSKSARLSGRYPFLTSEWAILFLTGSIFFMIISILVLAKLKKGIE